MEKHQKNRYFLSMCHLSTKNMAFVFTLFFVKQQENTWVDVSLGFEVHERFPAGRAWAVCR